ncbi:hypothetical protein RMN57_23140 [Kitasatospora sp. CM 4170]|uniref:C2H2-type domain-containing protein n=1 Tax=Kitasatospora aburaviensis TaxID=67265 RepID=A0ABW1F2Y9_9ACTN|nr:hypothetical protein [Kitasatospora sp. CM 4170]WNM47385.1 hypothetical protein RMN57_23140 [Kitasatospora sp. CM 4170]
MSETIGSPRGGNALSDPGLTGRPHTPVETVREAYSFACLSCGYGWEQTYDIEHKVGRDGHVVFEYRANGVRVPSPLLKPTCPGCGGHTVRIMREGRVAEADHLWHHAPGYSGYAEPAGAAPAPATTTAEPARPRGRWARFWSRLTG